jgi:thymidylate synthase
MEIIKDSAFEAWKATLKLIMEEGTEFRDHEQRLCKEVMNVVIRVNKPEEGITKPIEIMRGLKKWVYPELDELEDIFFKKESSSFYYYTYGARIFNYANVKNQVDDFVLPLLKKDPNSRRATIVLYQPIADSKVNKKETPGLISIFFRLINKKLMVTVVIRSNDMFIGWPANIYQIYLLQKYVAEKLGANTGSMTTVSYSAHIFREYDEEIGAVLAKR